MTSPSAPSRLTTAFDDETAHVLVQLRAARGQAERAALTERIVVLNLRFCECLASRFARKGAEWEDLVQVARTALLLAVQRFEPERGMSFHAFAVPTITGELKRYLRDHCWAVRPPRALQELRGQMRQVGDDLTQRLGHAPDFDELGGALGVTASRVREAAGVDRAYTAVSLEGLCESGPADRESVPVWGDGARDADDLLNCLILRSELQRLTSRERQILLWRFRDDCTQTTIANRLGVSQMQVSRTLARLLAQLRWALVESGSDAPVRVGCPESIDSDLARSA